MIEEKQQGDDYQELPELAWELKSQSLPLPMLSCTGASRGIETGLVRSIEETQQGKDLHLPRSSSEWKNPHIRALPPLRLFRVKELKKEEQILHKTLVEKGAQENYECSHSNMRSSDRSGDFKDIEHGLVRFIKEIRQSEKLAHIKEEIGLWKNKLEDSQGIKGKFDTDLRGRLSVDCLPDISGRGRLDT